MTGMFKSFSKEFLLILTLMLFTVAVNWPVVMADIMYVEQPIMYAANQTIHSFYDLINIYLHPLPFDVVVPFFRPSGHFLMYQLLTPLFGWHNTRALLIVNLLFLGMTGYVIIKLYEVFFPRFTVGGYIAFGFYLMNPALIVSRITLMHFEFGYILFSLASLYYFAIFCRKNLQYQSLPVRQMKFQYFNWLGAAAFFYIVAVTFKEPAIMLSPVLICYFLLALYDAKQPNSIAQALKNKEVLYILLLFVLLGGILTLYLTQNWQTITHPLPREVIGKEMLGSIGEFIRFIFSIDNNIFTKKSLFKATGAARMAMTPEIVHYIILGLLGLTTVSLIKIFRQKNNEYKKSIVFLFTALVLFLLLPIGWGLGFPWHLSLSLICEGMLLGFGVEFFMRSIFKNKQLVAALGISFAILIGLTTYIVDTANIKYLSQTMEGRASLLDRNAIFHPPALKDKLKSDSILIVEDNDNVGDYWLGDSTYPLMLSYTEHFNYDTFVATQTPVFLTVQPVYSGQLFRWAYLLPQLQEEIFPFQQDKMNLLPDVVLYSWLRHKDNIFCVTYDKKNNWVDITESFKKNLLLEQHRRNAIIYQYRTLPKAAIATKAYLTKQMSYPDVESCQTVCDMNSSCKGFTYVEAILSKRFVVKCHFYKKTTTAFKACKICTGYFKLT